MAYLLGVCPPIVNSGCGFQPIVEFENIVYRPIFHNTVQPDSKLD